MLLKTHLNFWGDKEKNQIRFHSISNPQQDIIIEVDHFDAVWEYLVLLSQAHTTKEIECWQHKHNISSEQKGAYDAFLVANGMVYLSNTNTHNTRLANFLGNWKSTTCYGESNELFKSKTVLILGGGTVGSALIDYFLQFGVENYILVDGDTVAQANIPHQRNFLPSDIGRHKCDILKEHILKISPESHVETYNVFLNTFSDFEPCIKGKSVDAIFWCIDQYKAELIEKIYQWATQSKTPIYMSGYATGGYIQGEVLTSPVVKRIQDFQKTHNYIISSNSGIGILGDISAQFMIRLWLQKLDPAFDIGIKSMGYNFCTAVVPNANDRTPDFSVCASLWNKLPQSDIKEWAKKQIVFPYFIMAYSAQLSSKSNEQSNLELICKSFDLDFYTDVDSLKIQYQALIDLSTVLYHGREFPIQEFSQLRQHGQVLSKTEQKAYQKALMNLVDDGIAYLSQKKQRYFKDYQKMWEEKKSIKHSLIFIAQEMAKNFPDLIRNENNFYPYDSCSFEFDYELKIIQSLNSSNPYLDFYGFVDYLKEHNYLHLDNKGSKQICVYNPRYGLSDVFVYKKSSIIRVFSLAHEIGHAYYNSFLPQSLGIINEQTAEICALLTEFQLMRQLQRSKDFKQWSSAIRNRLVQIFWGMLFVDIYEEKALSLPEITLPSLLEAQINASKTLWQDIPFFNDDAYRFLIDADFIAAKRDIYLYPEAMMLAIDLGFRIESNPSIQNEFYKWLQTLTASSDNTLFGFYHFLGIQPNTLFYQNICLCMRNWIQELAS